MKSEDTVLVVFVFLLIGLWGYFYYYLPSYKHDLTNRTDEYMFTGKDRQHKPVDGSWKFKHCTSTNINCGRFE
jgi:hypothetical protein